jgi:hypothetical protein
MILEQLTYNDCSYNLCKKKNCKIESSTLVHSFSITFYRFPKNYESFLCDVEKSFVHPFSTTLLTHSYQFNFYLMRKNEMDTKEHRIKCILR